MCLRYLLFQCFDPTTPDNQIHHYVNEGYYAFQEYAIVYWVDHLESLIEQLSPSDLENSEQCDLGSAIAEFYEIFGVQNTKRKVRAAQDELTEPKELKIILEKQKLNTYYGSKWIKCPRHACFYFHEGFPDEYSRDKHLQRHEKPFLCTDLSCLRKHWGYSTEKELKRHMLLEHPDPAAFGGLKIHQRKHDGTKPFKCEFPGCRAKFLRRWDRDRHARATHSGMGNASGSQSTQSTPVQSLP
ncbi:uncharacterized protein EAF02_005269 [Botrytis sinoallii]|uniref:uncharacterized protein n=1 Tax=Botrytis sinoallii TaxID=1463999 RepID=UPI0018FFA118|nr:uncharacterized protein EAF02_005269 [Botrytis sinoallii]KAF7883349.1 hypothetical protein EAF02_005269 [Botrytis sinoallii]